MGERFATVLHGEGVPAREAGGKGAALDRMIALRARVPPTGVITTSAYGLFTRSDEVAGFLDDLRAGPLPDPDRHEMARDMVDEVFLSAPMPPEITYDIESVAGEIAAGRLLAVRSSATAEDLAAASFAGQYESYLGVEPDAVERAVRRVWASLWYPAPRAYRQFRRIREDGLTMAVVVMRMLEPNSAGVLFTVDPGGAADAMRLEVVEGLGEKLVSGQETPDAYVVPRDNAERRLAEISAPLGRLAGEALRLEEAFEAPQDIEFAIQDGDVYLVQARPITALSDAPSDDDGFDYSCGETTAYTTAGIAEMLPGVLPPLSWTLNSWLVESGFRGLFALLGASHALNDEEPLIGRFRGRAALNLDALKRAATSVPGGSARELEHQYFGEAIPSTSLEPDEDQRPSRGGTLVQGLRVLRARRRAAERSEVVTRAVDGMVDAEPSLACYSDEALLQYWSRLLHLAQETVATEIAVAAMAAAAYRGLEGFLCRHMAPEDAARAAQRLTQKDARQRRSRLALALEPLVEGLRDSPPLERAAVEDWTDAEANLRATSTGQSWLHDFAVLLQRAGSTRIFAGPTWDEVPHLAWLTVYQELTSPSATGAARKRTVAREELEELLVATPRWRWARFVSGQLMDVRRRFLRREARDAAEFLQRRESTKAAVLKIGGVVRRANLEIGRRLTARGELETAEDVDLLALSEIPMLVGEPGPSQEVIAGRRRSNRVAEDAGPLPRVWTGRPEVAEPAVASGERLEGWSASPGRYEGVARLIEDASGGGLRRGEVLVATTTDASWAPLFMAAGAIVVEQGGPLSHAAIVARELGMPAVVNVPGVVSRLRAAEGSVPVVIDGTAGTVTILPDSSDNGHRRTVEREESGEPPPGADRPGSLGVPT